VPLLSVLIGFILSHLSSRVSPGGGDDKAPGRWLDRLDQPGVYAATVVLAFLIAGFGPEPDNWMVVAVLIMVLGLPFRKADYVLRMLPNPSLRAAVMVMVWVIPGFVFAVGRTNAWEAKHGHGVLFVELTSEQAIDPHHLVSCLGHLGDFFVLYEAAFDRLILVRTDSLTLVSKPAVMKLAPTPISY
jgi:hypothetical protein